MKKILIAKSLGYSMVPIINPGDAIWLNCDKKTKISISDIIVFSQGKILVSHRVMAKFNSKLLIKGDNCSYFDGFIDAKNIAGKVIRVKGKHGLLSLESKYFLMVKYYYYLTSLLRFFLFFLSDKQAMSIIKGKRFVIRLSHLLNTDN